MKRLCALLIFIGIMCFAFFLWWTNGLGSPSNDKIPVIFVIKQGEGVRTVANNLKEKGLIKDPVVFFLLTKKLGIDSQIQAGDFRITKAMNATEVAETLTHGTLDIWITVPEGKRASEISAILKEKLPIYKDSWGQILMQNEGYLFPDTYLIPRQASITDIVLLMRQNFDKRFSQVSLPTPTHLSKNDIVILASLIEREAKFASDRSIVASVIINRLTAGMPLQIDAAIQYALGYQLDQKTWWKNGLSETDLAINSPYNTYTHQGLPPGPIANPGLSSLSAAANPMQTNYLYYMSDKNGQNHYARTLAEHNANIKKYGL